MALTERLQILVTADAKGAASEFKKVGATADRELGRADDRVKKLSAGLTSFGTQTVLAAGVAGVGLYKAANAASAYGEQVSRATKTFGDEAVPELEAFADAAAETAGISKTAALQGASTFAAFAKQAGLVGPAAAEMSTNLVQLAGDFASFVDISAEDALTVFTSALSGEQEAIKRYGIDMSAAAVEQEALATGIKKGTGELTTQEKVLARQSILMREGALFAGDFADTSDSLANRQRQLAAEFENAKVALGEGLLPLAEQAVGAVQGLAGAFGDLDPEVQSSIGRFAGIAVAGAGLVGTLSLAAGQVLKLRDRFTVLTGSGANATRSLTGVGKAAAGLGTAAVGVGIVTALYEITNNADEAADALLRVGQALEAGHAEAAVRELIESTKDIDGPIEDVLESIADLRSPNIERFAFIDDMRVDIYDLKTQIESTSDAAEGLSLIDAIREMGITGRGAETLNTILGEQEERFLAMGDASDEAGDAMNSFGDETSVVGGVLRIFDAGINKAKTGQDSLTDSLKDSLDAFSSVADATESLTDATEDLDDARKELAKLNGGKLTAREEADALRDLEDAARGVEDAYRSLEDAQRGVADARIEIQRTNEDIAEVLREDIAGRQPGTRRYEEGQDKLKELRRDQEDNQRSLEDALRREQDAVRSVGDAKRAAADAELAINDQRIQKQEEYRDAIGRVEDAEEGVLDAHKTLYLSQLELNEGVADGTADIDKAKQAWLLMAQDAPPAIKDMAAKMIADLDSLALKAQLTAAAMGVALGVPPPGLPDTSFLGIFAGNRTSPVVNNNRPDLFGGSGAGGGGTRSDRPGRATGGPVSADETYTVNERGEELFSPKTNGFIINGEQTNQLLRGLDRLVTEGPKQAGGNNYQITVPVREAPSAQDIVRSLRASEWMLEGVG